MQEKGFKISLLILASVFLLGHQLTPHQHETSGYNGEKVKVDFYLALIFAPDLGPNHLQQYLPQFQHQVLNDLKLHLQKTIHYGLNSFSLLTIIDPRPQSFFKRLINTHDKPGFDQNNSKRGPPFSA